MCRVETVQFLLRECGADIADVTIRGENAWSVMRANLNFLNPATQQPTDLADLYSVLRCFGSPVDPDAFIEGLQYHDEDDEGDEAPAHPVQRELLMKTERAHASPNLLPYRLDRLDLLCRERDGGSDCARWLIPDLQNIVLEYLSNPAALLAYLSDAALRAEAVIAEAAAADEWARNQGRGVA
jgi:hypothetical protein